MPSRFDSRSADSIGFVRLGEQIPAQKEPPFGGTPLRYEVII